MSSWFNGAIDLSDYNMCGVLVITLRKLLLMSSEEWWETAELAAEMYDRFEESNL